MTDGRKGKASADALINVLMSFAFKRKKCGTIQTTDLFIYSFIFIRYFLQNTNSVTSSLFLAGAYAT